MVKGKKNGKRYKIIAKAVRGNQVAYLKRQEDGRYTINAGHKLDGYDVWFSTEAISTAQARAYFKYFLKVWFSKTMDAEDKFDKLSERDLYTMSPPDKYY